MRNDEDLAGLSWAELGGAGRSCILSARVLTRCPGCTARADFCDGMAQAAQQRAQLAELAALPLRAEALGADRQRNRYWLLGDGCGRGRLYVEEITAPWPATSTKRVQIRNLTRCLVR